MCNLLEWKSRLTSRSSTDDLLCQIHSHSLNMFAHIFQQYVDSSPIVSIRKENILEQRIRWTPSDIWCNLLYFTLYSSLTPFLTFSLVHQTDHLMIFFRIERRFFEDIYGKIMFLNGQGNERTWTSKESSFKGFQEILVFCWLFVRRWRKTTNEQFTFLTVNVACFLSPFQQPAF